MSRLVKTLQNICYFLHEVGVAVKSALEHYFGLIIWIGLILDTYCMKW